MKLPAGLFLIGVMLVECVPWLSAQTAGNRVAPHGRLKLGRVQSQKVAAGQAHAYELRVEAGQFVHLAVVQPGFPTVVQVTPASGRPPLLERHLHGGAGWPEPLYWIAPSAGAFRVEVSSDEPGRPAGFTIELRESRKATPQDETRVAGQHEFERASSLNDSHEYDLAMTAWQQALTLFQQAGDRERQGATLFNLGFTRNKQSQFQEAISFFERSVQIFREIREPRGEDNALKNLASQYRALNQPDRALVLLDQAMKVARGARDREGEALILTSYGGGYYSVDFTKAISYYEQALAIARAVNDRFLEDALLHNLGGVKTEAGLNQDAIRYFEMARDLAYRRKDRSMEAAALNGLGWAYNNLGRYDDAIRCYEQTLPIFHEARDRLREGVAVNDLGLAYFNLNQPGKAIPYYEQALAAFHEVHDRHWEEAALNNLAGSYDSLNQRDKALEYYRSALVIVRELQDRHGEGRLLMDFGEDIPQLQQALALLREAKDRQAEGWTLRVIGEYYRKQGQPELAAQSTGQAAAIAHELKDAPSEAQALGVLMGACKDLAAPRLAIFYGKRAVNLVQSIRAGNRGLAQELRQSLIKGSEDLYHTLADLLIAQGRLTEAEQVLALLKDEEYFNFLRRDSDDADLRTRTAALTPEEEAYNKRFNEIQDSLVARGVERGNLIAKPSLTASETRRLAQLEQDISAGNAAFDRFLAELRTHFDSGPAAARVQQFGESQGLMEDLRELPPGTVAIYTLVGDDKFRAILVTPDVQKAYEYPITAAELNRKVLEFRRVLQQPEVDPKPQARELYAILVEKMAPDLLQAHAQTLMWSLDGTLRYLPVAALYDGQKYLVENYALSEFTPVSNARLKDRPDRNWRAAGFGVTRAYGDDNALPAVASELTGIIARKPGEGGVLKGEIRLDAEFTQQAMRTTLQKRFQVVHIASHFNFQPGNETRSYLLLGDGTHLSLATLKNMPSLFGGVQLLTLSACNTGMGGEGANGQEVEGFGRLAQDRGAKAVVASLWSVADASTSLLMQHFYRLRQASAGVTKAQALREAQLLLLRQSQYAHPYHWAAFFLMGNWL